MTERSFVDTNVLVYRIDRADQGKQERARQVIEDAAPGSLVISTQVLQEFYAVATRKLAQPLDEEDAAAAVRHLSELPVVSSDAAFVNAAIGISRFERLSIWDALVVQAAVVGGCDRILSEDLADGVLLRGIRVENPFRAR